ncbi:MAG: ATP-dependent Lon protease, partial [Pseudonocardiales bacterium]|nr:ATP-dependent Lon protease [Pseudonocardiales bacterium]
MTDTLKLPVLPLTDSVVLPGMVVPIRLDQPEPRAAVDAAQNGSEGERRILLVPRPDGHYASVGTIAVLEQVGRMPTGEPAAVVRGEQRARIGSGVTGPGAALWVEATPIPDNTVNGRTEELAKEYKALVVSLLQRRNAWQVIDSVQQITDPGQLADTAGWSSWLDTERKLALLNEIDVTKRLELLIGWTREHLAEQEVTEKIADDVREG